MNSGAALLRAYTHNPVILEIGVSGDEIGAELFAKFQTLQRQKRSILRIEDIALDTSVELELSKLLFEYY